MVAQGYPVGVTAQILEQCLGSSERRFAVYHPRLVPPLRQQGVKALGLCPRCHGLDRIRNDEIPAVIEASQTIQELATVDLAQRLDGEQIAWMGLEPTFSVERQTAAGDEAVDMEMGAQLLIPGVQHHGDARHSTQVVAAKLQQRG